MKRRRSGLTLVELLVVMLILSILTVVAVQSTDSLVDQGRYDATVKTLQAVDEAIFGPANAREPDGTVLVSGFVADIGRLPTNPQELWLQPANVPMMALYSTTDPEVKVPCGWRSYLRMPTKSDGTPDVLRDSWANPLVFDVNTFGSLGANGVVGGQGYDSDITRSLDPGRYVSVVNGILTLLDANGQPRDTTDTISVVLYGPPDPAGPWPATTAPIPGKSATVNKTGTGVYEFSVSTTIGPRLLRAYEGAVTGGKKSRVISIAATPGPRYQPITIQP